MAEAAVETGKRGRKAAIKAEKAENAQPEAKPRGRGGKNASESGGPTFWQKVAAVAKADWGPRANIYLYRVEPVIDRRRSGSQTYITKYAEPISEDRILADHGSGRYKAMLNFRKPGAEQGDEVDSLYIDLLNLQFPPKIPPGDWVDDPNNKRWAWAKQQFSPDGQSKNGGSNLVEALDVLNEIQDSTTKRVLSQLPQPKSTADELVKFGEFMDRVRPIPPAAPPPDNSLAVFMQSELASLRQQIDKSRDREIELMKDMMKTKGDQPGGLSTVKELIGGLKDLLPGVKDLFPGLSEVGGRSRLGSWQELAVAIAPHASSIISPFSQVIAQGLMMKMMNQQNGNGTQQNPGSQPAQLPAGSVNAAAPATMMPFLQMVAMPMMNYIRPIAPPHNVNPTELGTDFASWVYDGFGADPRYDQAILAAKSMGPVGIIAAFRGTPLWLDKGPQNNLPSLSELETRLMPFFQAFLNWNPNAEEPESDDEPEPTDPMTPEVLNFDEKYAGAEA